MMTLWKQRKFTFNSLLEDIRGSKCCVIKVRQYIKAMEVLDKVSKGAKIRNRYNQEPHLTQDTNGKVTNSQLDTTKESQETSETDAHKGRANTRQKKTHKSSTNEVPPWNGQ